MEGDQGQGSGANRRLDHPRIMKKKRRIFIMTVTVHRGESFMKASRARAAHGA